MFSGESSDWSRTQTVTIGESGSTTTPNTSPTQSPTASPDQSGTQVTVTQQGFSWAEFGWFAAFGVVGLLVVGMVFLRRKKRASESAGCWR